MKRFAILACLLGLFGAAVGDEKKDDKKDEQPRKKGKVSVVKFELLKSGHMAVDVKVNGKGPYKLIFDTGAPLSLVNNKLAREAGIIDGKAKQDPLAEMMSKLGLGGAGEKKIKSMGLGEAEVTDVSVVVMDHPTVAALSEALQTPIYGLVGFPFFGRFEMTLDYEKKTMSLRPNGFEPPDVMANINAMILEGPKARTLAPSAQWGLVCAKGRGDEADGVDVKAVVPRSAADKGGIKTGDRLLTLDGRWTDSMADLYEAAGFVKAGRTAKVKVKRDGKEMELSVTPAKGL